MTCYCSAIKQKEEIDWLIDELRIFCERAPFKTCSPWPDPVWASCSHTINQKFWKSNDVDAINDLLFRFLKLFVITKYKTIAQSQNICIFNVCFNELDVFFLFAGCIYYFNQYYFVHPVYRLLICHSIKKLSQSLKSPSTLGFSQQRVSYLSSVSYHSFHGFSRSHFLRPELVYLFRGFSPLGLKFPIGTSGIVSESVHKGFKFPCGYFGHPRRATPHF